VVLAAYADVAEPIAAAALAAVIAPAILPVTAHLPKFNLVFGVLWHGDASLQIARNSLESFALRTFQLLADEISR
jgi:hypothetical protein